MRASYLPTALDGLEIHGGIDNLLDAEVDTLLGSNPGPYAYLGIRYGF